MKPLFADKITKNEVYLEVEKTAEAWKTVEELEAMLFGTAQEFARHFFTAAVKRGRYASVNKDRKFMAVIAQEDRVHIIMTGAIDVEKIKGIVAKEYEW